MIVTEPSAAAAPAGLIIPWLSSSLALADYIYCDGAEVSRVTFADLFAVIGISHGAGNGTTTFNVPDMRDNFARGTDNGRGVDVGRIFGSAQLDETGLPVLATSVKDSASHRHTATVPSAGTSKHKHYMSHSTSGSITPQYGSGTVLSYVQRFETVSNQPSTATVCITSDEADNATHTHTISTAQVVAHQHVFNSGGDVETRPRNHQVRYFIKS